MKTFFSVLFSLFLAGYPSILAQQYEKTELEQKVSRIDINEITRRANFSRSDVPIILIRVFDKDSRMPLDAIVELKENDKKIRESYYVGKHIVYYPYKTVAEDGIAVFSVALCDEKKINKLEIKCKGYDFYEVDFPLFTLLNYINSPLSSELPDSLKKKFKFKYDWENAIVFKANYNNINELIVKVSNLDIMDYSYYFSGESFYSNYARSVLGKKVPQLLNSYGGEEFHILIPINVKIKKTPQKIKIEK